MKVVNILLNVPLFVESDIIVTTKNEDQIIPTGKLYTDKQYNKHTDVIGGDERKLKQIPKFKEMLKYIIIRKIKSGPRTTPYSEEC